MSIHRYDRWKTFRACDDTRCFYCGAELLVSDEAWVFDGYCSKACGDLASIEQQARYHRVRPMPAGMARQGGKL